MIPYGKQQITKSDIDAVVNVLTSDWLTQGPMVPRFEQAIADKVHAKHAIAVNSATSALHIACLALGLKQGDYLWTSPNTFVASANCGLFCGAKVDFVDIDPLTYNISIDLLELKLKKASVENKLPKVLVPVHFAGQSCDMAAIHELSKEYGFRIIEDASHAIGASYRNNPVGCCDYSDIVVFSFHPVKVMTTGEGGVAVTNDISLAEKMSLLRTHGVTRVQEKMKHNDGAWYYEQLDLGFNYRITDIQAALGLSQLARLDDFISRRRFLASVYNESLTHLPLVLPYQHSDTCSAYHLYVVKIDSDRTQLSRKHVFDSLRAAEIGVNVHYIPVHLQPFYQQQGFFKGQYPHSERYYEQAITLPLFYELDENQQSYVINTLTQIFNYE